jgi:hypothetical protein
MKGRRWMKAEDAKGMNPRGALTDVLTGCIKVDLTES